MDEFKQRFIDAAYSKFGIKAIESINFEQAFAILDEMQQLTLTDVSSMLILTPKDAELFFNEVMNPKEANEALKKAMLKFITLQ